MSERRTEPCHTCSVGRASGHGEGGYCPLITRTYRAGAELYRRGDRADYVWFITAGAIEVSGAPSNASGERKTVGSFVGLESLVRSHHRESARVIEDATLCGATRVGFDQWLDGGKERRCAVLRDLLGVSAAPAGAADSDTTDE